MVTGPLQLVEVGRRPWDETEHPDDHECGGYQHGGTLYRHDLRPRRHGFASLRPVY
jgi:hypothetical protein